MREGAAKKIQAWLTPEEFALIYQWREAKKCALKQTFETETGATREAIQKMMRSRDKAPPLRAYECPICGKFHLTKRMTPPA